MKKILYISNMLQLLLLFILISSKMEAQEKEISTSQRGTGGVYRRINSLKEIDRNSKFENLVSEKRQIGNEESEEETEARSNSNGAVRQPLKPQSVSTVSFKNTITHSPASPDAAQLQKLTDQSPAYSFRGNATAGNFPPDCQAAAGPNHVLAISNSDFKVIMKSTGQVLDSMLMNNFFTNSVVGLSDPRILYDPYANRFVACATQVWPYFGPLYVAYSDGPDPTQGWTTDTIEVDPSHSTFADFPIMGFNKNWIIISARYAPNNMELWTINKADLYNGIVNFNVMQYDIMSPSFVFDNTLDDAYCVKALYNGTQDITGIQIYKISPPINSPLVTLAHIYNFSSPYLKADLYPPCSSGIHYPNCGQELFQPGTAFTIPHGGGGPNNNCVYRNGYLYFALNYAPTDMNGITSRFSVQWWKVDVNSWSQSIYNIDDPSNSTMLSYSSIAVNSNNDVVVSYSVSSANTYVSAGYSYYDSFGNYDSSIYKMGSSNVAGSGRFGDYSQTFIDPIDDKSIWSVNEIIDQIPDKWLTWVGLIPDYNGCSANLTLPNNVFYGNRKNETSGLLTSQEIISGSSIVDYDAGTNIILQPGFKAYDGTRFHGYINGCGGMKSQGQAVSSTSDNFLSNELGILPNPFSFTTNIEYTLVQDSKVDLKIYNLQMQLVTTLVSNTQQKKGKHSIEFNASELSEGIYLCKLHIGEPSYVKKLVLTK